MTWKQAVLVPGIAIVAAIARGQSTYIDFDIGSGSEGIGSGAPDSSFGGAAGVPGYWNRLVRDDGGPASFLDTNGDLSNVAMTWTGGAGRFGYYNTSNTGNYAKLLNDAEQVDVTMTMTLTGLAPGEYEVFVYAVKPQGEAWTTNITIPGAVQGTQAVTGPMPGNQLIFGITNSDQDIYVNGGPLTIIASGDWPGSFVNGLQILSVPEPTTISAFALGLVGLSRRRKRM